jgi:hypothetical protein
MSVALTVPGRLGALIAAVLPVLAQAQSQPKHVCLISQIEIMEQITCNIIFYIASGT